jgi:predicted MFS family arabinose efflux permease
MTLRNVATLSGDRAERFAGLFSGIYAGIMCGVAFGAVLADLIGYNAVLLVSAAMTLVAVVFPMTLRNDKGTVSESDGRETTLSPGDICIFVVFMALIAVPTCIAEAFRGYVLPLYVNKLELSTAYIGRVSLVYNLCLVYVGSTIVIKLVKRFIKNALFQSAPHLVVISLALFAAAYAGGLQGMIIAAALLGSADGFGFSVQNAFIVETRISKKIGSIRMLTWFSLLKKFGAMLGPPVFGLFIMNGFQGLGAMGAAFMICFLLGMPLLILFQKHGERL